MRSVLPLALVLLSFAPRGGLAQEEAPAGIDEEVNLGRPVRVRVRVEDGAAQLRVRGRGRPVERTLPASTVDGAEARTVTLAGDARVAIVEIPGHAVALVTAPRGRPEVLWVGNLRLHGDPGERRRDAIQIADRTGDGIDDVIVGYTQQGRSICGQEETLLEPRAVDPRSLELRSVSLRNVGVGNEVAVEATTEAPLDATQPLLDLLQPRGASSAAGRTPPPIPVALVDGDPASAWTESAPGPGRWEFATLRVTDPGLAVRALRIVPRTEETERGWPSTIYLQGDAGPRLKVTFPREPAPGEAWWVLPPDPVRWQCLSVILGDPMGEPSHVGLAELDAFTEIDFGGGVEALVRRLASGAEEGARAARALRSLGPEVIERLEAAWAEMTPVERRLSLQVAAAHPSEARAHALFVRAAADDDETVREAAVGEAEALPTDELLVALVEAEGAEARAAADAAAIALSRRSPGAVGAVMEALAREGGADRPALRTALRTAAVRGDDAVREAISEWLASAPTAARASAALGLAGADAAAALAIVALEAAPSAEAFADRWRFAQAAAKVRETPEPVRTWLAAQAADAEEWMMRATAVEALAFLGAPEAGAVARRALDDDYPRVRVAAVEALGGNRDDAGSLVTLARRDPWPMVRAAAVAALGPLPQARPLVRAAVRDRHELVRAAAIAALARAEDWEAWPAVAARLEAEKEWPVVLQAGVAYARARCERDAVAVLDEVIDRAQRPNPWQPDVEVAAEAVEALAAIGGEEAAEAIRKARSDLSPQMIRIAAQAADRVPSCHQDGAADPSL